ncbi:hypothetical protein ACLB2K_077399 [Fragaria x ananassa]
MSSCASLCLFARPPSLLPLSISLLPLPRRLVLQTQLSPLYHLLDRVQTAGSFSWRVGGGVILSGTVFTARPLAAIQALMLFKKLYPEHRREEIENCIVRAAEFIEKIQATDGSWYGSWGVCFTYAGWFGIKGLIAAGRTYEDCSSISKACDFLLSKELASGGWGESYLSCQNKEYSNLKDNRPHIVNTAWAMLALLGAGQAYALRLKAYALVRLSLHSLGYALAF